MFLYIFVNEPLQGKGEVYGSLLGGEANFIILGYAALILRCRSSHTERVHILHRGKNKKSWQMWCSSEGVVLDGDIEGGMSIAE